MDTLYLECREFATGCSFHKSLFLYDWSPVTSACRIIIRAHRDDRSDGVTLP